MRATAWRAADLTSSWIATAEPITEGATGTRYFWVGTLGTIYADVAAIAQPDGMADARRLRRRRFSNARVLTHEGKGTRARFPPGGRARGLYGGGGAVVTSPGL